MHRCLEDSAPLLARVKKIAGQVNGVGRMIEDNRDCPEILHTLGAVHAALRSLEARLLEDHVRHCVQDAASNPEQLEFRLTQLIALYKRRHD